MTAITTQSEVSAGRFGRRGRWCATDSLVDGIAHVQPSCELYVEI